ncbi:hypothetical protein FACS189440_19600 [Bacteroidia bacterium]|nr:hypothetical protein FACS189423_07800 [Bacteroidia bacterium]GHT51089.1 hypothetical protein FACS189440_19600 [Bacteroidia bacterium]
MKYWFTRIIYYLCEVIKIITMARPIKETPIISGEDARRFREAMENLKPLSKAKREEQRRAYEWFKSRATFPML